MLSVSLSVCLSVDKVILKHLKYTVICSIKGTIITLYYSGKVIVMIVRYMISWSSSSRHFLFLIIALLLRPSSILIYDTKHVSY